MTRITYIYEPPEDHQISFGEETYGLAIYAGDPAMRAGFVALYDRMDSLRHVPFDEEVAQRATQVIDLLKIAQKLASEALHMDAMSLINRNKKAVRGY